MRPICRFLLLFVLASAALFVAAAQAQDEPSLGDVARQTRQRKEPKDVPAKAQPADGPSQTGQDQSSKDKDAPGKDMPAKDTPAKDTHLQHASHVITDDELPRHAVAGVKTPALPTGQGKPAPDPAFGGKMSPDEVKSQIQEQKSAISALQAQITELNDSIHFVGGNCVSNCVAWNENQQAKQRQVEDMRSQLDNAKQALEQMQDYARKMGFGSSVYEPEQ